MNKSLHTDDLTAYLNTVGASAKKAANALRLASNEQRNTAIIAMAAHVRAAQDSIITANAEDMRLGEKKGLSPAMLDRLKLDKDRIESIATGLEAVAALPDPVGAEDERWTRPNGLTIAKIRTPIGVIGMIYESRPNVTADAASLCLKSGNACVLRGGSEALRSNTAIHQALVKGLTKAGLPEASVQYINTTDRAAVGEMLAGLNGSVDLIIPRGGKGLVGRVQSDARVPVLAHLEGLNHTYIHADADPDMARDVVLNAKMRRTGICGSTETVLIDEAALSVLPGVLNALKDAGCAIKGDEKARKTDDSLVPVTDADFRTEYLDAIINVKVVADIDEALTHIAEYGSGHTDAIITASEEAASKFLSSVDSAIVLHNASTQYADGGEFGFGAEIGIATGKLHARGPVGAQHLTSYKYQVFGNGQTRP
ncbi:MAG: glutamate-5-semialdehyde dehydrogenase [Acidimicrobiales bacterium]|nr:glutamate-5-semialdehyde dehydrogenase [Hyphomonadaceae bacterium]RZV35030.1 MAG: glutamate-5-semialdehyde dehydrogenase [Acidimicrobiales bacterium]